MHECRCNRSAGTRDSNNRGKLCTYTVHVAAGAVSHVDSTMVAAETADDAMNANGAEAEALVTATTVASTVPTLVRAPTAPSASRTRVDSVMAAEAAAEDAMNADGAEAEAPVTASAKAHTVLTLVRAPAAP